MTTKTKIPKEKKEEKKVFVLDTNVLLHDSTCLQKFKEHDIILLTIVLEEMDKFKKESESLGYNARQLHRMLDGFRKIRITKTIMKGKTPVVKNVSALFNGGVSLGDGLGKIEVKSFSRKLHPSVKDLFFDEIPDHQILSATYQLKKTETGRAVILVTKDINLRLKAEALGIDVEDYESDKIPTDISILYSGKAEWDKIGTELVAELYKNGVAPLWKKEYSPEKDSVKHNMYVTIHDGQDSVLGRIDLNNEGLIHRVEKKTVSGITPRNAEQAFTVDALLNPEVNLLTLLGKAGTGKTLLAIASAIEQLVQGKYEQIIIAAAMVPLSNKDIGALPGDANEKVSPFMQGLYDNIAFIKSQNKKKVSYKSINHGDTAKPKKNQKGASINRQTEEKSDYIEALMKEGKIKIQPLASIRGRSFNNTVFIIDEAQNLTPHEVKTIITRAGENTLVVFCGDVQQIDSPYLDSRSNGLSHIVYRMAGQLIVAHVTLEKGERSYLAELAADLL